MTIKKPKNKPLKFISNGIKATALATMLGLGGYTLVVNAPQQQKPVVEQLYEEPKHELTAAGKITLAMLKDIPEDEYENAIPLYPYNDFEKPKTLLKNKTLIIVDDSPEHSNMCGVTTIGSDLTIQSGYVQKSNIGNYVQIDEKDIEALYIVNDKQGVNFRNSPKVSPETKISALPNGTLLLGSSNKSGKENWSNVLHFDGTSLQQGFVASEFIKSLGAEENTVEMSQIKREKIAYITENDEMIEVDYNVENGKVFGIDLYDVSDPILQDLLSGKKPLPDVVQTNSNTKVNLSRRF